MLEISLDDTKFVKFVDAAKYNMPVHFDDLIFQAKKDMSVAIQGDILEAIESYHPYHAFMAARTRVSAVMEGNYLIITVEGRPEGELQNTVEGNSATRRPGTKPGTNLWQLHEFGGSTGAAIAQPGKPMPIIKAKGDPPVGYAMSTGQRELHGTVIGVVKKIVEGLTIQIKNTIDTVIGALSAQYKGYLFSSETTMAVDAWAMENKVKPLELLEAGVTLGAKKLYSTDNTTVYEITAKDTSTTRFMSLGDDINMKVEIIR